MRSLDDADDISADFARSGIIPKLSIPVLRAQELWERVQPHRTFEHWLPLLEALLISPKVPSDFIEIVVSKIDDESVLNAAATSGNTPEWVLEHLATDHLSPRSVREHAFIGLLRRRLPRLEPDDFASLIQTFSGDAGIALGVRHVLASSPHTPVSILEILAHDEVDFVRDAAFTTLRAQESS